MKKLLFIINCSLLIIPCFAQQSPTYSQSILNPYLLNPAYAGENSYTNVFLHARNEFANMPDSPESYQLSMDGTLSNSRIGLGFSAFNNIEAIFKNMGLSATYRYKMQFSGKHFFSGAVSGGIIQNSMDFSKMVMEDPSEISDFNGIETTLHPDVNVGLLYQYQALQVGFSVFNLTSPSYKYKQTQNEQELSYRLMRNYRLTAAYKQSLYEDFRFDALVLMQSVQGLPLEFGISGIFNYADRFWLGVGYKYNSETSVIAGLRVSDQLLFSYSYGFSTAGSSDYRAYLGATHEIALSFRWQRANSKTAKPKEQRTADEVKQLHYAVESQGAEIDQLKQENEILKQRLNSFSINKETLDSLLSNYAVKSEMHSHIKVMEYIEDTTQQVQPNDTTRNTPQKRYHVVIAAVQSLSGVKDYQKLLLKNLQIETSVLDPEGGSTYYFIYTGNFETLDQAQTEVKRLYKLKITDYIDGEVWIYKSKSK